MTSFNTKSAHFLQVASHHIEPRPFRLGMPHLNADGLSPAWLMREAGHIHWLAIAEELGAPPPKWVDAQGRRCFASVVTATLSGSLQLFQEDTICRFRVVVPPTAETSWLSQIDLESADGQRVCVEIMTLFAALEGSSNVSLVKSAMSDDPPRSSTDPNAMRARNLQSLAKLELKRAGAQEVPPQLSFRISKSDHLNGVGLVYFAQFQTFFAHAEENAIPAMPDTYGLVARRVHYYGNLDPGDSLDLVTEVSTNVENLPAWLIAFSSARRRSDGKVIATCESSYRVGGAAGFA